MSTGPAIEEVVEKVCAIPSDFRRRGDVSVVYLLEESQYDAVRDAVTVDIIQHHLQSRPHLIDDWSGYSMDKRCSSGWYFNDHSAIGHFSSEHGHTQVQIFRKRARACAEFIKLELESIRANPSFGSGQKGLEDRPKRKR